MMQKFLKRSLIIVLVSCAFQSAVSAHEKSPVSVLAKDDIFHSPRGHKGHKGHRGHQGHRGKKGIAGATGATGATGADVTVSEINGYVFNPTSDGSGFNFSTVGFLNGVAYDGTNTFTIQTGGDYRVSYALNGAYQVAGGPIPTDIEIVINGVGILGSRSSVLRNNNLDSILTAYEGMFTLNAGDTVRVGIVVNNSLAANDGSFMVMKLN